MPSFAIDGLTALKSKLRTAIPNARKEVKTELYQFSEEVMTESKQRVPVLTGTLMSTGHVGRRSAPGEGVAEGPPYEEGESICIDLGYGGPAAKYALYVHEALEGARAPSPNWSWTKAVAAGKEINWTRPSSGPKYLENPLKEKQDTLAPRLRDAAMRGFKQG